MKRKESAMQSLIRCPITRYSTINLSNPLFIFDFWKLDSFLAQLTELLLSFCRKQWNNFEKSKCMGREYNRCLLVKKYSPSLVFTNMSFTDGRRWSQMNFTSHKRFARRLPGVVVSKQQCLRIWECAHLHAQKSSGSRLGKQVMTRTCELRHSALSEYSIL